MIFLYEILAFSLHPLASMDLKLTAFSVKSRDFSFCSTKFVVLSNTKDLFMAMMVNDDLPEAEPTLSESPNADQQAAYENKIQEQRALFS